MNKIASFVKLDFITIKPYLSIKNLALFILIPLVIRISTGESSMAVSVFVMFGVFYISYPFIISERNNLDSLYPTLAINRKTVVLGRYLFVLVFDIFAASAAFVFSITMSAITGDPLNIGGTLIYIAALSAAVGVMQIMQIPLYFKLGYSAAKMIAMIPFFVLFLIMMLAGRLFNNVDFIGIAQSVIGWVDANTIVAVLCGIAVLLAITMVSYRLSQSFYGKRDF